MKKLDEEAVGGLWGRGVASTSAGAGVAGGQGCSFLVVTGHFPAAPEEDELQRHAPGHRGSAPGEAEGPEDPIHRAQWQWEEHERVSGLGAGVWVGRRVVGLVPALQPHALLLSAGTPSPSEAAFASDPCPNFNIK